jgi:hypothetical protein
MTTDEHTRIERMQDKMQCMLEFMVKKQPPEDSGRIKQPVTTLWGPGGNEIRGLLVHSIRRFIRSYADGNK